MDCGRQLINGGELTFFNVRVNSKEEEGGRKQEEGGRRRQTKMRLEGRRRPAGSEGEG